MSQRADILTALRAQLDDLCDSGTSNGWLQDGVQHASTFETLEQFTGLGRCVYGWLGAERKYDDADAPMLTVMALELNLWGTLLLDTSVIEDEAENMLADLKRAVLLTEVDNAKTAVVLDAVPSSVSDREAHVYVRGEIVYAERIT